MDTILTRMAGEAVGSENTISGQQDGYQRVLQIKVWGCRGSYPAPFPDRMEYGGNTSCISMKYGDDIIVLDAGSGIVALGRQLDGEKKIHVCLSHVHLDHIMGLFLFQPVSDPEMEIHLYGPSNQGETLEYQIEEMIRRPYWPVDIRRASARMIYHTLETGSSLKLSPDIRLRTEHSNHPGDSLLYRFDIGKRSVFYGTDCEMNSGIWEKLISFGKGADLLICDAQYRPEELEEKKGWGHSSWREGNALLRDCNGGRVLHTHFDWSANDEELRVRERLAASEQDHSIFAREGLEITI